MSIERLTSQADEDYFRGTPCSARKDIENIEDNEDPELNLDTLNIVKGRRMVKTRSRTERSEINSVCRADNVMSKTRKRKAKLRSSVSKSTITTKDTGFIGKKDAKRRRHRGGEFTYNPSLHICFTIISCYHQE